MGREKQEYVLHQKHFIVNITLCIILLNMSAHVQK